MSSAKRPRCNTSYILAALPGQTPTAWQLSGPTSGPMRLAAISVASLTQMSNYSPPSDPRVLWPGLELRLSSPADRCAKRVGVRTVTPHFCSTSTVLVKSPSRSHPCDGRTDLIPGCSLHFLYPKFQQPRRPRCHVPRPSKRRKLLASWGKSSSSQGANLGPRGHDCELSANHFSVVEWKLFSYSDMSDSLQPHELQHTRPPCPSPTSGVHPNPCPLSRWCHPTILSSVIPFNLSSNHLILCRPLCRPPALNLFQHQGLFKWVSSSHEVAKVLEFQLQHQSFQWTPRTDLL